MLLLRVRVCVRAVQLLHLSGSQSHTKHQQGDDTRPTTSSASGTAAEHVDSVERVLATMDSLGLHRSRTSQVADDAAGSRLPPAAVTVEG